jgi:hypothetical protein
MGRHHEYRKIPSCAHKHIHLQQPMDDLANKSKYIQPYVASKVSHAAQLIPLSRFF